MTYHPIAAIEALGLLDLQGPAAVSRTVGGTFAEMLAQGIQGVDQKIKSADAAVTQFALDDSVPPHRVMFALEEAQHALTMMMQVRSRALEAYQELMRMQL